MLQFSPFVALSRVPLGALGGLAETLETAKKAMLSLSRKNAFESDMLGVPGVQKGYKVMSF